MIRPNDPCITECFLQNQKPTVTAKTKYLGITFDICSLIIMRIQLANQTLSFFCAETRNHAIS